MMLQGGSSFARDYGGENRKSAFWKFAKLSLLSHGEGGIYLLSTKMDTDSAIRGMGEVSCENNISTL